MTTTTRPMLRRGDNGQWVRHLQQSLVSAGFDPGTVDGSFGETTAQAVLEFQSSLGLDIDGVVGPATWDALGVHESSNPVDDPPTQPDSDWSAITGDARLRYVMALLVERYGYPVNGAAGIVGNLWAESGVLPNRIEGSSSSSPMRARNFAGDTVDFTADEIMNRDRNAGMGPALPGVGLAQWTSSGRRNGLFQHSFDGRGLGTDVLFDMDLQVDYLDHEMRVSYTAVRAVLTNHGVSIEDACDEVVYNFEVPGSVLEGGKKLPRTDPRVQQTFEGRRVHAQRAAGAYFG